MLKRTMKLGLFLIALMLIASVAWAAGGRDVLRGQNISIGHWWTPYDVNTVEPNDEIGEMTLEWRKRIQREHNFTVGEREVSGWGGMLETVTTSIMAGRPAADAFKLEPGWAISLYRQGLLFPVSDNTVVDIRTSTPIAYQQVPWNQRVNEAFTFNGKVYAFSDEVGGTVGVYYNKRLFREAGLDPELPYNMQRDGTWTWDNFLDICKRLTRDRNNRGRIDTWAMPTDFTVEILDVLVFANGGNYITKDASGKFVNSTARPEFIEAMQFAKRLLNENVLMPKAEDANWDWFLPAFMDGHVAMLMDREYRRSQFLSMADDWGYVVGPKGPRLQNYRAPTSSNLIIIPSTYNLDKVNAVMQAVSLWYTPVTSDWKASLWSSYKDARAVNESLTIMRDARYNGFRNYVLIPNLNRGNIAYNMWYFDGDPAQLVESVSQNWNALISDAN